MSRNTIISFLALSMLSAGICHETFAMKKTMQTEQYRIPREKIVLKENAKDLVEAMKNSANPTVLDIPSTYEGIAMNAFEGCDEFTSVVMHDGMLAIGRKAFTSCTNLKSVVIPDSVDYIGSHVFEGCSQLTDVKLSNTLKYINGNMFTDCINLKEITLPDSIEQIGVYAFSGCINLTNINLSMSLWSIYDLAFNNCRSLKRLDLGTKLWALGGYWLTEYFCGWPYSEVVYKEGNETFSGCDNCIFTVHNSDQKGLLLEQSIDESKIVEAEDYVVYADEQDGDLND